MFENNKLTKEELVLIENSINYLKKDDKNKLILDLARLVDDIKFVFEKELNSINIELLIDYAKKGLDISKLKPYMSNEFNKKQLLYIYGYIFEGGNVDIIYNKDYDDYKMRKIMQAVDFGINIPDDIINDITGEQLHKIIDCFEEGIIVNDFKLKSN